MQKELLTNIRFIGFGCIFNCDWAWAHWIRAGAHIGTRRIHIQHNLGHICCIFHDFWRRWLWHWFPLDWKVKKIWFRMVVFDHWMGSIIEWLLPFVGMSFSMFAFSSFVSSSFNFCKVHLGVATGSQCILLDTVLGGGAGAFFLSIYNDEQNRCVDEFTTHG